MKRICGTPGQTGLGYLLYEPEAGDFAELPLLVFLHGAGERGTNLSHVERHGVPREITRGREYPALVLCPQCPADVVWDNIPTRVKSLIDAVAVQYGIRRDRICLTGSSMGGFGTWMLGLTYPNFFSGIAPVAGGGMSWRCRNLRTTPVYAMHGACDEAVPAFLSQNMVEAVRAAGGDARLKLLPGCNHNEGIALAYSDGELIDWLLSRRRTDFTPVPESLSDLF